MLTRRVVVYALPLAGLASFARANRPLSHAESQALLVIQSITAQEASRLHGLAAGYQGLADQVRAKDATLAAKLTDFIVPLRSGIGALSSARSAFPVSVRPSDQGQRARIPRAANSRSPRGGLTVRPSATVTVDQPSLEDLLALTRFGMRGWLRTAQALGVVERETGLRFSQSIGQYNRAAEQFIAANTALGRISSFDRLRNEFLEATSDEKDSRGNFEIDDLLARSMASETLVSSVLRKRQQAEDAIIGYVG